MPPDKGNSEIKYVLIAPEHFVLIQNLYDASLRHDVILSQVPNIAILLNNINQNLARLVEVTLKQDERQDDLIAKLLGTKSHVPYTFFYLIIFCCAIFISVLLLERSEINLEFGWPTGFKITHATDIKPLPLPSPSS